MYDIPIKEWSYDVSIYAITRFLFTTVFCLHVYISDPNERQNDAQCHGWPFKCGDMGNPKMIQRPGWGSIRFGGFPDHSNCIIQWRSHPLDIWVSWLFALHVVFCTWTLNHKAGYIYQGTKKWWNEKRDKRVNNDMGIKLYNMYVCFCICDVFFLVYIISHVQSPLWAIGSHKVIMESLNILTKVIKQAFGWQKCGTEVPGTLLLWKTRS